MYISFVSVGISTSFVFLSTFCFPFSIISSLSLVVCFTLSLSYALKFTVSASISILLPVSFDGLALIWTFLPSVKALSYLTLCSIEQNNRPNPQHVLSPLYTKVSLPSCNRIVSSLILEALLNSLVLIKLLSSANIFASLLLTTFSTCISIFLPLKIE